MVRSALGRRKELRETASDDRGLDPGQGLWLLTRRGAVRGFPIVIVNTRPEIATREETPLEAAALIWTVTFDAAGAFSGTVATINGQGAVSNGALSGTYTIAADGAATVSVTGSTTMNGSVSADGGDANRLVLAQVTPGQMPSIAIGVRQGQSAFTNANVEGTYRQVLLSRSVDHGAVLTISFDGAGHFSYTEIENDAGVITPNAKSGSYNVGADGAMTLFITDDLFSFSGGVSADANTLVLTRTTAGQPPNLTVAVKQARNTFTPADFNGPYELVAYRSTGEFGVLSTITPDGAGSFSATETRDDDGTIANVTTTGTYRVDSSGALTLTVTGGSTGQGGLSTDAHSMALTETTSGVYPSLEFAIK